MPERYYKIEIEGGPTWDSTGDPNALNVEIDVFVAALHAAVGGSWVRVWGIGLQTISQANDFNNKVITVTGGFQPGLPLATAASAYAGMLFKGRIWPAFGNWIGTDMTLDLVLQPYTSQDAPALNNVPAPIVHNWKANTPLKQALQQSLSNAFPAYQLAINISDQLKLNYDDTGWYKTAEAYAGYIHQISQSIMGDQSYPGVHISFNADKLNVTDFSQSSGGKMVKFIDLIGQPTWLGFNQVQVKSVMRADIQVGDTITLPQTQATVSAQSGSQFRNNSGFQGSFNVQRVRHVGNFRQPDGASWVTVIDCVTQGGSTTSGAGSVPGFPEDPS